MKKILSCSLLMILIACGYRLVGTAPQKEKIHLKGKKVAVLTFRNRTSEPHVESFFTSALANEILKTSDIKLVNREEADYLITGEISGYHKETMTVSKTGEVLTYRLTIYVNIVIEDKDGNTVATFNNLSDYEDFKALKEIEKSKSAEWDAARQISRNIAQMFLSMVL